MNVKQQVGSRILTLLVGACFLYFSNGILSFAIATWLYSFCFLHISRNESLIYARLIIPVLFAVTCQLSYWNFLSSDPTELIYYLPFILGLLIGSLYLVDRWCYQRLSGFGKTLVFPLLYTSFEFLFSLVSPIGTASIGYSQFEFLSFSQLASITGMWGLTFMIAWFGSVMQWSIDSRTNSKQVSRGIRIYAMTMSVILLYGLLRLSLVQSTETVQVSGIHAYDKDDIGLEVYNSYLNQDDERFTELNSAILESLITQTKVQAAQGAEIVVWGEISYYTTKSREQDIQLKLQQLAQQEGIYLFANPFVLCDDAPHENKIQVYDPEGTLVMEHYKYGGNQLEGTLMGNQEIHTIQTPLGKLSGVICWDADFPAIVRQVGRAQADILIIPASDWWEITPFHAIAAVYRGIENGCSIVRQTRNGLSIMTSPLGQTIAQMNHYDTDHWVLQGAVPARHLWTLYPHIGDLFGWICLMALFCFLLKARKASALL